MATDAVEILAIIVLCTLAGAVIMLCLAAFEWFRGAR